MIGPIRAIDRSRRPARRAPALEPGSLPRPAAAARRAVDDPAIVRLQRSVGNAAVAAALRGEGPGGRAGLLTVLSGSGGRPIEAPVRRLMEERFGRDFGDVRIHTGRSADASVRELDAHACTVGGHIVFRSDRYRPWTEPGLRMLAHELAHVVQQRSGEAVADRTIRGVGVTQPSATSEREADRVARAAVPPGSGAHNPSIDRPTGPRQR